MTLSTVPVKTITFSFSDSCKIELKTFLQNWGKYGTHPSTGSFRTFHLLGGVYCWVGVSTRFWNSHYSQTGCLWPFNLIKTSKYKCSNHYLWKLTLNDDTSSLFRALVDVDGPGFPWKFPNPILWAGCFVYCKACPCELPVRVLSA